MTIGKYFGRGYYFGNYNIFKNVPSEFNFKAIKTADNVQATKVFALPKQKLLRLLKTYPDICSRMIENSKRNASSLRDILKYELKLKLQIENPNISNEEIDQIFKTEVIDKVKIQTNYKSALKNNISQDKVEGKKTHFADNDDKLREQLSNFNKTVGEELDEIVNKLHKLRDQIGSTKDKMK